MNDDTNGRAPRTREHEVVELFQLERPVDEQVMSCLHVEAFLNLGEWAPVDMQPSDHQQQGVRLANAQTAEPSRCKHECANHQSHKAWNGTQRHGGGGHVERRARGHSVFLARLD
jgi:hypothetical protein